MSPLEVKKAPKKGWDVMHIPTSRRINSFSLKFKKYASTVKQVLDEYTKEDPFWPSSDVTEALSHKGKDVSKIRDRVCAWAERPLSSEEIVAKLKEEGTWYA